MAAPASTGFRLHPRAGSSAPAATGILDDRVFLLPPFTQLDAARAIRSLRTWPMLEGYRGAAPADTDFIDAGLRELLAAPGYSPA